MLFMITIHGNIYAIFPILSDFILHSFKHNSQYDVHPVRLCLVGVIGANFLFASPADERSNTNCNCLGGQVTTSHLCNRDGLLI